MDLGLLISVTGLKEKDFVRGAAQAKRMGYSYVELGACVPGGGAPAADLGGMTPQEAAATAERVRGEGVGISALQAHVDLLAADPRDATDRGQHIRRVLEMAAEMAVPFVHTISGPLPEGMSAEEGFSHLADAYSALLDHAAQLNVGLGIEAVFVYAVGNLATMRALDAELGRGDLEINFDPSHFPYHREDPIPFIEAYGGRIPHAHAKDATVTPIPPEGVGEHAWDMGGGEQFRFAPPGTGVLDWSAIIAALRRVGFDGVLSLELGHGIDDELAAAAGTVTFLRPLLA